MTKRPEKDFTTFLLYAFGFLLLWEWLRPIDQLTDTGYMGVFLFFIAGCFIITYSGIRRGVTYLIKTLYILFAIQYLYFEESFFSFTWVSPFVNDFIENLGFLVSSEWSSLTNIFRTLLFFVLLWLMTYLIEYWLINRRRIFIFFFMTLVYITVLDTFTPYEATYAIVRTVVAGFAVMGILTFYRIMEKEALVKDVSFSKKWMFPLVLMIAFSVTVGYAAPKADPIWPDPVPFLKSQSKNSGSGSGGVNRVGYGTDDSQLGGPFVGDNQVVFRSEVESRHYWKVESKDVYTGKGWIASVEPVTEVTPFEQTDVVPITSLSAEVAKKEQQATIYQYLKYDHINYPIGIKQIQSDPGYSFSLNPITEKITSLESSRAIPIDRYTLVYDVPNYSVSRMKETTDAANTNISQEFLARYTQLPENLPSRVAELAAEITQNQPTWFDKTRAVESYFDRSEYLYDQKNVALPGVEDDYVDQFLFETKQGYCDNFSSSMVVMLRTLGIPSRWVKGYTEGEYKDLVGPNRRVFEVTNNNAHSWVEVYFPNVGWVPFEPTKGFANNVQLNFDTYQNGQNQSETPDQDSQPVTAKPEKPDEDTSSTSNAFSLKKIWSSVKDFFGEYWKYMALVIVVLGSVIVFVYQKRTRWIPYYYVWMYGRKKDDAYLSKAFLVLLKQLDRYGLKRKEDQTLRNYARYIDTFFSSKEMSTLTTSYEQLLYRGTLKEGSWQEIKKLWENLIKRTSA